MKARLERRSRLRGVLTLAFVLAAVNGASLSAQDCNRNGVDDAADIAPNDVTFEDLSAYDVAGSAQPRPVVLIAADLNGDPFVDLFTANEGSNDVSVLLGGLFTGDYFDAPTRYPVGLAPAALIAADLDGDGRLDLAAANAGPNDVSVLRNRGDGTFLDAASYPVGMGPRVLVAADFDGDGTADLATANFDSRDVSVLLNDGGGAFATASAYPVGLGEGPVSLVAADLNGDEKPDLASTEAEEDCFRCDPPLGSVSVLVNSGDGAFAAAVAYRVPVRARVLLAANLSSGVSPDLAAAGDNGVALLLGRGDGAFEDAVPLSMGVSWSALVAADLNGDGELDLVGPVVSGICILLNQGGGAFLDHVCYDNDFSVPRSLVVADFDRDGSLDLARPSPEQDQVSVLLGQGDGTFRDAVRYPVRAPEGLIAVDLQDVPLSLAALTRFWGSSGSYEYSFGLTLLLNVGDGNFEPTSVFLPVGDVPVTLAAADFDGDDKLDLVTGNDGSSSISVLRNRGDGTLEVAVRYTAGLLPWTAVAADLDGDGKADIVTGNRGASDFSVLLNRGDGTFDDAVSYAPGRYFYPSPIVPADLDRDGSLDLVTGDGVMLRNLGDGAFASPVDLGFGGRSLVARDLDGNGSVDLALTASPQLRVALNRGDGTFDSVVYRDCGSGPLTAADFDGDGRVDLAGVDECPGPLPPAVCLVVRRNQGDGRFGEAVRYPLPEFGVPASVIAADLNGDAWPDLATENGGEVFVLLNGGDGGFLDAVRYQGGTAPPDDHRRSLLAADFNGDGRLDLATGGGNVLLNRGDGVFSGPAEGLAGAPLLAADLDGDGRLDLAAAYWYAGSVFVRLNRTTAPASLDVNTNGVPDECETLFHRGDANDDGAADVSDAIAVFGFLFLGGEDPPCRDAADANGDGGLDVSDGISLLNFLFLGGRRPAAPGPPGAPCGLNPGGSTSELGCVEYDHCS